MSDHGFANFGRQFNLNSWLRDFGYLNPRECSSILQERRLVATRAYGLGINGLYLNLKGRERDGVVEPGEEQEEADPTSDARLAGGAGLRRPAGHSPSLPSRRNLLGRRDRVGARPDHRLLQRLPRVLGDLSGRADGGGPDGQRLGLECRPLCRCAGGARRAVFQSAPSLQRTRPGRSCTFDPRRIWTSNSPTHDRHKCLSNLTRIVTADDPPIAAHIESPSLRLSAPLRSLRFRLFCRSIDNTHRQKIENAESAETQRAAEGEDRREGEERFWDE